MARHANRNSDDFSSLATFSAVVLVIGILYFAQEVLLPIAMAVLLAFVLTPLTLWLERLGLSRIASVLASVLLAFGVLGGLAWVVTDELVDLARDVPRYQQTLIQKIRSVRDVPVGGGLLAGLTDTADAVTRELKGAAPGAPAPPAGSDGAPLPVRIVEGSPLAVRVLLDWLGPLLAPFSTAALVLLFVIFILLAREDLRNRMIRLAGTGRVYVTTQAFDEAGGRISRYLLMQLIINATYGGAVAIGLFALGVPSAILWGLLATVMRFVPYVGPWIAAVLPIALSLAVFEGWTKPFYTVGLFLILELVSNNVVEPWLYGSSTGVSTVGIMVSAVFWTWLWGPLGLVLSTPLTVCLTVLGRHVPRLTFLNVLLSDQPALQLDVRFYQRLLALDYNEASDLVTQATESSTLDEIYEQLFVPALSLAERDRHEGNLTPDQAAFIYRSIADLMSEVQRHFDTAAASEAVPAGAAARAAQAEPADPAHGTTLRIACVPAEDDADRLASEMLVSLLRARGHQAETVVKVAGDGGEAAAHAPAVDCAIISGVAPGGAMAARDASRRLIATRRELPVIVGLWHAGGRLEGTRQRLKDAGARSVHTRFSEALAEIRDLSLKARGEAPAKREERLAG